MIVTNLLPRTLFGTAIIFAGLLAVVGSPITAQEDEVWEMEENYWTYVKAGDVEKYRSLWNDDFVGWPCSMSHPSRKANIGGWVARIRDKNIQVSYDLTREAVQYFGDVAVVHYTTPIILEFSDGTTSGGQLLKFTHTWKKFDDQWQIITGMCAAADPVE
jgi:ketosteroid isomerase-like protein